MDLIQRLILFADIVEKGSIASAARSRESTRSAVSKQLARLEQETGMRLLNRNTRSMSLTGPGRMLYEQAQRIRENQQETVALIADIAQQVSGELRITASLHLGRFLLPGAIRSFSDRFPQVIPNLQLTDSTSDIIAENIDLAIRIGNPQDSRLIGRKLCDNPVVMVASPAFLDRQGIPKNMQALEQTPCVTYENLDVAVDQWVYLERGKDRVIKVQSGFKSSDGQLLRDACLAGYGVALLPTYIVVNEVRTGRLKVVLPKVRLRGYQAIHLVYASRKYQSPALKEFLAHIQLWIQQHPIPSMSHLVR